MEEDNLLPDGSSEDDLYATDDSNAEDNWRNDYPDEDEVPDDGSNLQFNFAIWKLICSYRAVNN